MADTKALPTVAVEYPSSDGRMIAELPLHGDAILYALATLRIWFARRHRVQAGASMFLYYQAGHAGPVCGAGTGLPSALLQALGGWAAKRTGRAERPETIPHLAGVASR